MEIKRNIDKQTILKKIESLNNDYLHILLSECTADISCPHCNSKEYKKHGKTKKQVQRYRCKTCKKTYVETYCSALFKTHKDYYQWFIFLKCYLNGDILDICAKEANIHHNTAFRWRHKLNDAFLLSMNTSSLTDEVFLDETLYPRIEKGNEELIHMKRNKVKRGISDQKVNICCAIDSNNHTVIRVSDCGRIKSDKLISIFSNSIENNTILVTDSLRS